MAGGKLVMHTNAGDGESSYASRSSTLLYFSFLSSNFACLSFANTYGRKTILKAKPVLEDVIKKMFNNVGEFPKCLNMALSGIDESCQLFSIILLIRYITKRIFSCF
ncbi:hypothetical protein P3S67_004351 [Capsicum chacoense]